MSDYNEIFTYDTDPWLSDSDGDGVSDSQEIVDGTDPRVFGSFLRHVTMVVTADDSLTSVTNYVSWGTEAEGWSTNDMVALVDLPATNEFTVANSNATVYAKAYRDMNRNGAYDPGEDILLLQTIPDVSAPRLRFAFGDVDGDGVSDAQERIDGTDPYDVGNFRLVASIMFVNSDVATSVTNYCAFGHNAEWENANMTAFSEIASIPIDTVVTNGFGYAKCLRDFDVDGGCLADGDMLYVRALTKADNRKTVTVDIGDCDGDKVFDSEEVSHGTNPRDAKNYCFNLTLVETGVIRTTNDLTVVVMFGNEFVFGPALTANGMFNADIGHLVATNGEGITVRLWDDSNVNGVQDPWEYGVSHSVAVNGHASFVNSTLSASLFDRDGDGIPDWWELAHADLGMSPDVAADACLDPDFDGLINLHEYWAGTNMLIPDGSNTLLSVCARSVDMRLVNRVPESSLDVYSNYVENASMGQFVRNEQCWAQDVDISCASPWHVGQGRHADCAPTNTTVTAISKRHVLYASHFSYAMSTNLVYYFHGHDGVLATNRLVALSSIGADIGIGLLENELPDSIVPAKFLPDDFADYIGNGKHLPSLILDQNEKAFVAELGSFPGYDNRYQRHYNLSSRNAVRSAFAKNYIGGDSSSPRFLVIGNNVVVLGTLWHGGVGGSCLVHLFKQEIQSRMNQLCPGYLLTEIDFSGYDKLHSFGGN